jgi:hypothetical protein
MTRDNTAASQNCTAPCGIVVAQKEPATKEIYPL